MIELLRAGLRDMNDARIAATWWFIDAFGLERPLTMVIDALQRLLERIRWPR